MAKPFIARPDGGQPSGATASDRSGGSSGELPVLEAEGLLLLADPHFAATPPGQRLESYPRQIADKVAWCLRTAADRNLVPVILGDLFHWPRENPNSLLVSLIDLFREHRPWILVGNHDKYLARFTPDVSLAVLNAAGVVRLLDTPGFHFRLRTPTGEALCGASPDMAPLPSAVEEAGEAEVIWFTHHGFGFRDYEDQPLRIREIPGLHWVFNGHLHTRQPTESRGGTRWVNQGSLSRVSFSRRNLDKTPQAVAWRPGGEPEFIDVPHLGFYDVFPDQPFASEDEPDEEARESNFLKGLERLAWRRTREGAGLKQFLLDNLEPGQPESSLVWELYKEITDGDPQP